MGSGRGRGLRVLAPAWRTMALREEAHAISVTPMLPPCGLAVRKDVNFGEIIETTTPATSAADSNRNGQCDSVIHNKLIIIDYDLCYIVLIPSDEVVYNYTVIIYTQAGAAGPQRQHLHHTHLYRHHLVILIGRHHHHHHQSG